MTQPEADNREQRVGIYLAIAATLLWSGNFIVARGVIHLIPPVALAFLRWLTATLVLLPFAWRYIQQDWPLLRQKLPYLLWTALMGISVFNTLVYVAGHYAPAINLALIGTTSSPVFSMVLAAIFLKERLNAFKVIGFLVCFSGILLLVSGGSWEQLRRFQFSRGDLWVLAGAFAFSIYTIQVRRKPAALNSLSFLWVLFALGTALLFPAFLLERQYQPRTIWSAQLFGVVLYLGIGASAICFFIWNKAIARLGAARTALFGNLIPLFSTIEAVLILGEPVRNIHLWSGLLILTGLVIANKKAAALPFYKGQSSGAE